MSGQRDLGFALPAASGFGHRRRAAADSPSWDATGSSRGNRSSGQAVDSTRDGFSDSVEASSISGAGGLGSSGSELQNVGMTRQGASDAQISAFTAVSHYPGATDNGPNFHPMSEVVNAVMERGEPFRRGSSSGQGNAHPGSSSSPAGLYMSDSEMGDALGDLSAPEPAAGSDVDMEGIVQRLIRNTAIEQNVSTFEQDAGESADNLLFEYGSAMLRDMSTPSTPRDDDPDDTRRFYLDDDEGDVGYTERAQRRDWDSQLSDVDFDDFYRSFDYDSATQMMDTAAPAQDDIHFTSDGDGALGEDLNILNDDPHFLATAVHGTSTQSIGFHLSVIANGSLCSA
jgi:hypothetical protein